MREWICSLYPAWNAPCFLLTVSLIMHLISAGTASITESCWPWQPLSRGGAGAMRLSLISFLELWFYDTKDKNKKLCGCHSASDKTWELQKWCFLPRAKIICIPSPYPGCWALAFTSICWSGKTKREFQMQFSKGFCLRAILIGPDYCNTLWGTQKQSRTLPCPQGS